MFYCTRQWWLNGRTTNRQEQPVQTPKPFAILRPGQNPTPLFVIHAYSIEQARTVAAAMVAGETIVLPVTRDGAGR